MVGGGVSFREIEEEDDDEEERADAGSDSQTSSTSCSSCFTVSGRELQKMCRSAGPSDAPFLPSLVAI